MGEILSHKPVLLIAAAFSRHESALIWGKEQLVARFGPVVLESELFIHNETNYYDQEMGQDLKKQFWAFERLINPEILSELKIVSNQLEEELISSKVYAEDRPINIDPGYITESKLILATTKDRNHRIYLKQGIFAEITLQWQHKRWQTWPWTYLDYQRTDYHQFFTKCREYLRQRYQALPE